MERISIFFLCFLLSSQIIMAKEKRYIFSVKIMEEIAKSVKDLDGENGENRKDFLDETHKRLFDAYPELIIPPNEGRWVFNAVGGSLAEIKVLFCSTNEYIALWGSPLKSEGFSGRYKNVDVWDIMISGIMKSYAPGGNHQYQTYINDGPAGTLQTSLLKKGVGKHFTIDKGAYMIDYGRGALISAFNDGAILGHKYVTGDKKSQKAMLNDCAKMTFKNWSPQKRRAIKKYKASNPDFI